MTMANTITAIEYPERAQSRCIPDLREVPHVPWAWVDEHVYARIRGCSVQLLRHERQMGRGCPYRKINGTMIRYRLGDIQEFIEKQPGGPEQK
jgi:hypothetical protein